MLVQRSAPDDDARRLWDAPVREVARDGDAVVVRLGGELDLYNAPAVREALESALAERTSRIVVDLSEVVFVDSTALGVLIDARGRVDRRESFVLAAAGVETRRTLAVSGLDRHFAVTDSVDEALRG
jgi:anti-sigma B factor antagonist